MKKLLLILSLAVAMPIIHSGCSTPPSARVVQVQSLKAVGHAAESAVALSAQLYRDGKITSAQAYKVAYHFDRQFQPAFRLAVAAVNANLDSAASPDLVALAAQLSSLVVQFQSEKP